MAVSPASLFVAGCSTANEYAIESRSPVHSTVATKPQDKIQKELRCSPLSARHLLIAPIFLTLSSQTPPDFLHLTSLISIDMELAVERLKI
jgi:hypothetical protein